MTGKRIVQIKAHNRFVDEAFYEKTSTGEKTPYWKAKLKNANRKVRRDKNYKNEL